MQRHDPFNVPSSVEQHLNELLHQPVELYLINGVKLTGRLLAYDEKRVLIGRKQSRQFILLHAVSTISDPRFRIEQEIDEEV